MKKFLIAIICIALLLTGCGTGVDEETVETTGQSEDTDAVNDGKIYVVENGLPLFTIVYGASDNIIHAEYIANMLKAKTGVVFKIANSPSKVESGNIIYVGLHDDVDEIYKMYGESISYDGYGAVHKGNDVYVCGYNETTVGKAAKKFISEMITDYVIKDETGKTTEAYFTEAMFFLSNPSYEIKSPLLLGVPLTEYTVVLGTLPDLSVKQLSKICCDMIGKRTGAYVRIREKCDDESRIELTLNNDMELFDYTINADGKMISVNFGGISALYSVFEELCELSTVDTANGISIAKSAKDTLFGDMPLSLEAGADIRVMSANVLGTGLEESYQCSTELRAAIMAEYIMALSPDSVGLQEYYGSYTAEFMSVISKKYQVVTFENFGAPMVSTVYLKDKYALKECKAINIRVEEYDGDPGAQNYYFTWTVLEDAQGEEYIHANLHLEYRNDTLRLDQCDMVNKELANVMARYPDAALVITGDYNSKISNESPIFNAIKGDYVLECAETVAPEGKRDDDRSSFHTLCSYSNIITNSPSALDHVMVSTDTLSVKLHKIIYDALICHASDHCPVVVDIARR